MADFCKHWLRGSCRFAASCRFPHGDYHDRARAADPDDDADANALAPATKKGWPRTPARVWMHVFLHKRHPLFDLVPILIGMRGKNMKAIFERTGAKIRIRGKGSKHYEVEVEGEMREAPIPLMIAITQEKTHMEHFRLAVTMTLDLLVKATDSWKVFCKKPLYACLSNERIFSRGAVSRGAEYFLSDLLDHFPAASLVGPPPRSFTRSSLRAETKAFEPMVQAQAHDEFEYVQPFESYFAYNQPFFEYAKPHVDPRAAVEPYGSPNTARQEWHSSELFFEVKVDIDEIESEAPDSEDEFAAYRRDMKDAVNKFVSDGSDSDQ